METDRGTARLRAIPPGRVLALGACGDEDRTQIGHSPKLSWGRSVAGPTETVDFAGPGSPGRPREFTPEPEIADGRGVSPTAEIVPVVRNRLRALALLYLALFAILPAWRLAVHRETDGTTTAVNALAVLRWAPSSPCSPPVDSRRRPGSRPWSSAWPG